MAIATAISRLSALAPLRAAPQDDAASIMSEGTDATSSTRASSLGPSFDSRSCHSEPASAPAASSSMPHPRRNEHLAVLLPKRLWKPDSQAAHCDTFLCRKPFSIWERRHHCRKCGGVYCGECSSRSTPLLDTAHLEFLYPPRNVSIYAFATKDAPVLDARVCDDCWLQIHGRPALRAPVVDQSESEAHPIALLRTSSSSPDASSSSSLSSSVATPPEFSPLTSLTPSTRPTLRRTHTPTSPRPPSTPLRSPTPLSHNSLSHNSLSHSLSHSHSHTTHSHNNTNTPQIASASTSPPLGELSSYPLARASRICKATGGGRWAPTPAPRYAARRIPGRKAPYEEELEREAEERRVRRANPVVKDGDFQLRAPREWEPRSPAGPITLSTF